MSAIQSFFFNGEVMLRAAPTGQVRPTRRWYFGGSFADEKDISPYIPVHTLSFDTDVPSSIGFVVGNSKTITVSVSGEDGDLTYQWYKNGVAISGATSASYELTSVAANEAGDQYYVIATDTAGDTKQSGTGTIAIYAALSWNAAPPAKSYVLLGNRLALGPVVDGGVPPLAYSWTNLLGKVVGTDLDFAIEQTTSADDNLNLTLTVTDANGNKLVSDESVVIVYEPFTISEQPESTTITAGKTATIAVVVDGGATDYTYAWYVNGTLDASATESEITTPTLQVADSGWQAYVVITDAAGNTLISDVAKVTVNAASS